MTLDDLAILIPVLIAAATGVAAVRFTFRFSSSARAALFSPVVFAVCGALIGISLGMLFLSDEEQRVDIGQGMLMVLGGSLAGAAIGALATELHPRMQRGQAAASVFMLMVLGGCVAAPIGWISGSVGDRTLYELKKQSEERMGWGFITGMAIGGLSALPEILVRRRGVA
jgi:hypothetical protein